MLLILGINSYAQLTLTSKLLIDDQLTNESFNVTVINTTDNITNVIEQKKLLKVELQYDKEYVIIVSKKGFKAKAISVDTYCNIQEPVKYFCYINLLPTEDNVPNATLVGGIYYNESNKQFDYYLKQE